MGSMTHLKASLYGSTSSFDGPGLVHLSDPSKLLLPGLLDGGWSLFDWHLRVSPSSC